MSNRLPPWTPVRRQLAVATAALVLIAGPAWAMECPAPTVGTAESDAKVAQYLTESTDLGAPDMLQSTIFDLKQAGVEPDLIVDKLITLYCGQLASDSSLDDQTVTQKLQSFSKTLDALVYSQHQ